MAGAAPGKQPWWERPRAHAPRSLDLAVRDGAGIDDRFINRVKASVTPGTSALLLLTSNVVSDRVLAAIQEQGLMPELISSNLSSEQEARLRAAFGETD